MVPSYVLGTKGALLVYDTTRMQTLETLEEWVNIARTHNEHLPILLLGTKIDLEEDRSVPREYATSFLEPLGIFDHLEVSAKTGENVEKAFEMLVRKIIGQLEEN